ncbi:MAG: sulfotransferase domain-containing protein [Rhodospirillales bacterium]|nr:sulfotransferase domain-containing protein [Rhodospirillales bacterium]
MRAPFIIFAHARSGSTNLSRALQCHPDLHIAEEPFHEKYHEWNPNEPSYLNLIRDIPSLDKQTSDIFRKYNGIKVLNYQLSEDLYTHLLLRPEIKVIYLKRSNLLQAVVSNLIARQTGVWQPHEKGKDYTSQKFAPLPLEEIEKIINYEKELRLYYDDLLNKKPAQMLYRTNYEDLYLNKEISPDAVLHDIYRFLGLPSHPVDFQDYLNYKVSKINPENIYDMLPNAKEINEKFGCDETGWLYS